jgi:hypothetical protein
VSDETLNTGAFHGADGSELERQVEAAKRRNRRAEDVVATAHHLLPESP